MAKELWEYSIYGVGIIPLAFIVYFLHMWHTKRGIFAGRN
jgi:hypothetical protein